MFSDDDAAALYDTMYPWDPEIWPADGFYDELVMAAGSVLDVGCGTGGMLAPPSCSAGAPASMAPWPAAPRPSGPSAVAPWPPAPGYAPPMLAGAVPIAAVTVVLAWRHRRPAPA